ncbi:hypothetical protein GGI64_003204 [Rhizobium leguminosarum]|uniref:Uncharacterized protein n=2 Tax=Rhizobium leguminosarum TaxID=384 RepID=A0A7W9ZXP9_RHILE|nr:MULTISPECIES: hypothetical protein [Rhizobium]ACI57240.1 conserved hypothetical protein [Rhizobium leguminosarum bv. trifolii WSM2304]MBB3644556.1 hypothetical protein [Rhizobium sp. BK619]MBB5664128.1 hypothetical protein [Rhizobium leguminosarum]MBB6224033.1 hypothetical protein [Rhizobium leguminosarum]NYJ12138.1 hypothetical protein [Rhizobium leguminosarum]
MPASRKSGKVFYMLSPSREGLPPFSDIRLPDGTIIRRVDEAIHKRALSNAAKALKERLDR